LCSSGAHGFSALIETTVNEKSHTLLFDTGPDSKSIIRNVHALKAEEKIKKLERIVLSHWHKDHSGGLLSLLELRNTLSPDELVTVDLHPDRPIARGRACLALRSYIRLTKLLAGIAPPPTYTTVIGRLPEDPTFEEVESRKGMVEKNSEGHLVAGGTVFGGPLLLSSCAR
jgi:glyoxylase-like metal-dependent hydrolase (beta-lactamase superfamily II)